MKNILLVKHNKISIYGVLAMENSLNTTTPISTSAATATASDEFENTHNYCARGKCIYNPKEKATLTENANKCLANFCVGCSVNMGDCNPRQYCYKTYCPFEENEVMDAN